MDVIYVLKTFFVKLSAWLVIYLTYSFNAEKNMCYIYATVKTWHRSRKYGALVMYLSVTFALHLLCLVVHLLRVLLSPGTTS